MGGPYDFSSAGVLCQKNLCKAVLLAEQSYRRLCALGWSATWMSYSHVPRRQKLAPSRALEAGMDGAEGGLEHGGKPPPNGLNGAIPGRP